MAEFVTEEQEISVDDLPVEDDTVGTSEEELLSLFGEVPDVVDYVPQTHGWEESK